MNWLDISTYIHMNLGSAVFAFFLSVISAGMFTGMRCDNSTFRDLKVDDKNHFIVQNFKWSFCVLIVGALFVGFLPTHDRILQVKIAKIKNEALTQANLNKGVEAIERITQKLECKYLGGCEEKK